MPLRHIMNIKNNPIFGLLCGIFSVVYIGFLIAITQVVCIHIMLLVAHLFEFHNRKDVHNS